MGRRIKSREKQTSKGERPNTNPSVLKAKRRDYMDAPFDRLNNQVKAWRAGKKVMVTIENPNKKETNKPFIKVPARQAWGVPKEMQLFTQKKKNNA